MSTFDATAATFERYRAFPNGVAGQVRSAVWHAVKAPAPARVLDLGAGTGRIGRAFVAAGDPYVGVDLSYEMLREFRNRQSEMSGHLPCLLQAAGERLPFPDRSFDAVLFMQVLSGARDWQPLLTEARRVLRPAGAIIVGQTAHPPEGIDRQMKMRLAEILEEMGAGSGHKKNQHRQAMQWLESVGTSHHNQTAASWTAIRTPGEFLLRHRTGAQFSALPVRVQEEALKQLREWAVATFGSLDAPFTEEHAFELDIFEF